MRATPAVRRDRTARTHGGGSGDVAGVASPARPPPARAVTKKPLLVARTACHAACAMASFPGTKRPLGRTARLSRVPTEEGMWIPHFLLEFWEPQTSDDSVEASQRDASERTFEIWFALEDPPTRLVEDSGLALAVPEDKTQTDGAGREVKVRFQPNEKGRLGRVGFKVVDTNAKAAFRYCYNQLSKLLSFWSLIAGFGCSIYGLLVHDEKHGARWKVVPQIAAPEPFAVPLGIGLTPEYAAVISLYREGRNTPSPFYRFLCHYKILEAWYRHGSIFGQADRIIRERGLPFRRPRRTIAREMLNLSLLFTSKPEFLEKTFGQFFDLLNAYRVKVAHAITDAGTFINLDEYEAMVEIAPIANLTDLVARQIILDELDLWEQIRAAEPPGTVGPG